MVVSEEVKLTEDVLKSDDHDKIKNMVIKKTLQGTPVENMPVSTSYRIVLSLEICN